MSPAPSVPLQRTGVLVLGMHRSGTSALTRMLNLLGLPLGEPLLPPRDANNEAGFWELAAAIEINEQILDAIEVPWDAPDPLPERWQDTIPAPLFESAVAVIERNFSDVPAFALKDPRICRLWPFWLRVFAKIDVRPLAMHMIRPPPAVARSLAARDGLSAGRCAALWTRNTLEAEDVAAPRLLLPYDTLVDDVRATIDRAREWLSRFGVATPAPDYERIEAAVRPSLRHHRELPALTGSLGTLATRVHAALTALAGDPASCAEPFPAERRCDAAEELDRSLASIPRYEAAQVARLVEKVGIAARERPLTLQHVSILELRLDTATAAREASRSRAAEEFAELARLKALTDQHVVNLEAMVATGKRELEALRGSRSYRLTFPLRAAATAVRMLLNGLGLRTPQVVLVPGNEVEPDTGGGYRATGHDPWFALALPRQELWRGWPRGWYAVRFRGIESVDNIAPKLYVDYGQGYSEQGAITLPVDTASGGRAFIRLRKRAASLRLDPADRPARFRLEAIELRRVPAVVAVASLVWPLATRAMRSPQALRAKVRGMWRLWRADGFEAVVYKIQRIDPERRDYKQWVDRYDAGGDRSLERYRHANDRLSRTPRISVLVPVYNTPEPWLRRCIDSVLAQTYPEWELCIADDASTAPHVGRIIDEYTRRDPRVRSMRRDVNGHIVAASNSALELARGEFVALLDHDDELAPWALYWIAETIDRHPDAVLVYSDEDKIDEGGHRFEPYFKPDWNPELLLAQNFVAHLGVYRKDAVVAVGGFREGYEGSQDWDLVLRVAERCRPDQIRHVPRILYHWRSVRGSTALHAGEKSYAADAGLRAVRDALDRAGVSASVERIPEGYNRVRYALPDPAPVVSIIVPTRNALVLVRTCLESLLRETEYAPYEVLLIDNQSDDAEALAYFAALAEGPKVRLIRYDAPFNFAAINNFGAAAARGSVLVLLNNDIEITQCDWLAELVRYASRPQNGVVGAKLLYPDQTIQHAGVVVGFGGVAGHIGIREPRNYPGQMSRCRIAQNLTGVTAACLAVRKAVYEEAGGMDAASLGIAFNDIDLCLKVAALGYRNVWTPHVELVHRESATRGHEDTPEKRARFAQEIEFMQRKWGDALMQDPAYNPNLDLERQPFALAFPPRVAPVLD